MSSISPLRNRYWVWAVGWGLLLAAASRGDPPAGGGEKEVGASRPLPAKVVRAWQQAGAEAGWLRVEEHGGWWFFHPLDESPRAGDMPGFRIRFWRAGFLSGLPAPQQPFGLDLGGAPVTDAELKELAGLKNLQKVADG
jgi:hypothetical protein